MNNPDFTALVSLADQLAKLNHQDQKYGLEDYYTYHIKGIVSLLEVHQFPPQYIIVGYLHDIVEDTTVSLGTIYNLFGEEVGDAVKAITRLSSETYDAYIDRCRKNKIARIVKVQDAIFNATNCFKNKNKSRYNHYITVASKLQDN